MTGRALDGYFAAVVEATEEAVLNSLLQAETVTGRDGHTSFGLPAGAARAARERAGPGQPGTPSAPGPVPGLRRRPAASGRTPVSQGRHATPAPPAPPVARSRAAAGHRPVRLDARPGPAAMRDYLAAERAWYDAQTAARRGLREELSRRWPPGWSRPRSR